MRTTPPPGICLRQGPGGIEIAARAGVETFGIGGTARITGGRPTGAPARVSTPRRVRKSQASVAQLRRELINRLERA